MNNLDINENEETNNVHNASMRKNRPLFMVRLEKNAQISTSKAGNIMLLYTSHIFMFSGYL